MRISQGLGRYGAAAEEDLVWGRAAAYDGTPQRGVLVLHGASGSAADASYKYRELIGALARGATVHVGDYGLDQWAGPVALDLITQAVATLRAQWNVVGPLALVGVSMGGATALAWALEHPGEVACVAGITPLTDLAAARANQALAPSWPVIDGVYPPAYDDARDGPAHSPIRFATDLDPVMPVHLWTASDDTLTPSSTADAFAAARPQTGRSDVGALGHTTAAVVAATPYVVQFVRRHLAVSAP